MKRPVIVTIIGYLFIISGIAGIVYHGQDLSEIFSKHESFWILLVRVLAIVGGWFTLRGKNWARWLSILWIAFHVVLSAFHSFAELAMHAVIMILIVMGLFYKTSGAYFNK